MDFEAEVEDDILAIFRKGEVINFLFPTSSYALVLKYLSLMLFSLLNIIEHHWFVWPRGMLKAKSYLQIL